MDHGLGGPTNEDENFPWMEVWFRNLFCRFAFMYQLCFALVIAIQCPLFIHKPGYIMSRFSAVNDPHHIALDDWPQAYGQSPYHRYKLGKQSVNGPLTCVNRALTPCFVDVGHCCSRIMS
ncbi:hypothetical protein TNCV_4747451 [Trichonephila clavipes]|nr:hypothetical protein TNCV_4747451 [Trichonephila clavipes]